MRLASGGKYQVHRNKLRTWDQHAFKEPKPTWSSAHSWIETRTTLLRHRPVHLEASNFDVQAWKVYSQGFRTINGRSMSWNLGNSHKPKQDAIQASASDGMCWSPGKDVAAHLEACLRECLLEKPLAKRSELLGWRRHTEGQGQTGNRNQHLRCCSRRITEVHCLSQQTNRAVPGTLQKSSCLLASKFS